MITLDEKQLFRSVCDLHLLGNHNEKFLPAVMEKLRKNQPHRNDEPFIKAVMVILESDSGSIEKDLNKIDEDYKLIYRHVMEQKG